MVHVVIIDSTRTSKPTHALSTLRAGHMEKQETEIKRKLEMETGNGNRKLKTEMETKDAPITGAIFSS